MRALTASSSAGLSGPRFEPLEDAGVIGHGGGGGGPAPEVLRVGERLADEARADRLAISLDQAAIGLALEGKLGDDSHQRRVEPRR